MLALWKAGNLPGFTEFYWVLPGFTEFLGRFSRVSPGFVGYNWVILGFS